MAQQSDFNALFPKKSSGTVHKRNPDSTAEDCIPNSQMSNSRDVQWTNCFDPVKAMWLIFFMAPVIFSSLPCSVICPPVYCCLPTPNSNFPENRDHDCLVFCSLWSFRWAHRRSKNWLHQSLAVSKIQRLGPHLPASLAAKRLNKPTCSAGTEALAQSKHA